MTNKPKLDVKIFTSSSYAYRNMTEWRARWLKDDFTSANGKLVANRDLLRRAYDLLEDLEHEGAVTFVLTPEDQHNVATEHVTALLDNMQQSI